MVGEVVDQKKKLEMKVQDQEATIQHLKSNNTKIENALIEVTNKCEEVQKTREMEKKEEIQDQEVKAQYEITITEYKKHIEQQDYTIRELKNKLKHKEETQELKGLIMDVEKRINNKSREERENDEGSGGDEGEKGGEGFFHGKGGWGLQEPLSVR